MSSAFSLKKDAIKRLTKMPPYTYTPFLNPELSRTACLTLPEFPIFRSIGAKMLLKAMELVRATLAEILGTQ